MRRSLTAPALVLLMLDDILPQQWIPTDLSGFRLFVGRKHLPIDPEDLDPELHLLLLAHLAAHRGWPPPVGRDYRPKQQQIGILREAFGPLAFLRFDHRTCDHLPLKSEKLRDRVRRKSESWLRLIAPALQAYIYAIQRGGQFGFTHEHLVLPLQHMTKRHQQALLEAQRGAGGGCILIDGRLPVGAIHGVIMGESAEDDERVSRYLSRDPDGRLDEPGTPSYFDALEAELRRLESRQRSPRLSAAPGVQSARHLLS